MLLDLFVVALGAVAAGWVCRRLNVPEVIGYLAAGMILGQGLHAFADKVTIQNIGTFAVVFRMFTLGLDFDARRLRGRWRPALTAGLLEMGVCSLAGVGLAMILGWTPLEGAVLGAAMGTTSTSILSKALADRNMSAHEDARAAGSATLTEDLIVMGMLALLTVFGGASKPSDVWESAIELLVFASLAFTAGAMLLPLFLDRLARTRSDELLTMAVVGVLFGFAALSFAIVRGPAVGAFLAGIAVGAARNAPGVAARVTPLRDLLTPVVYVSLGIGLDLALVIQLAPIALLIAIAFVAIKLVAITVGLRMGGVPATTAARASAILGQVGTMGLVWACKDFLGPSYKTLMAIAFVAWAVTVALTSVRLRFLPDIAERVARALGAKDRIARSARLPHASDATARSDAYVSVLAIGGSTAVAALVGLGARANEALFWNSVARGATVIAGGLAGAAVLAFAVVAASSAREAAHHRVHEATFRARHMARGGGDPSRTAGTTATVGALALAFVLPLTMIVALAPQGTLAWLGAGALAAMAMLLARPSLLARFADEAERLARAHGSAPPDPRLHDFRGVSPFGFDVEALALRSGTRGAWATVRALAVPEKTGARIVAIIRPGMKDGMPVGPETTLHPGDEVVLGGSPAQVVAARRYLLEPSAPLVDDPARDDRRVDRGAGKVGPRIA